MHINTDFIDPAYRDMELKCRNEITAYLESLSEEKKRDFGIAIWVPSIPADRGQVLDYIAGWVQLYEAGNMQEEEDLKAELIEVCEKFALPVNSALPLAAFQQSMKAMLEELPEQQLLELGVFGSEITEEQAKQTKEIIINSYINHLQQAAYDQILIDLGKLTAAQLTGNYQLVAGIFPELVQLLKENLMRRNLLN